MARRWLDRGTAADLGQLDVAAIERVREEAWPDADNADELHDALLGLGVRHARPRSRATPAWPALLDALARQRRATRLVDRDVERRRDRACVWVAAERLPQLQALSSATRRCTPPIDAPAEFARRAWTRDAALVEIVRSRLEGARTGHRATPSPRRSALPRADVDTALAALAAQGVAMAGTFTPRRRRSEWCDAALLARIHRYTVKRLRAGDRAGHARRTSCASCSAGSTRARRAARGPRRARRGHRAAAGLRGAGRGVGVRDPAGAPRRLRHHVARRSVPVRAARCGRG